MTAIGSKSFEILETIKCTEKKIITVATPRVEPQNPEVWRTLESTPIRISPTINDGINAERKTF